MAQQKIATLRFPLGGLHRRLAFQQQEPYTTPDCENVRPRSVLSNRLTGGSRPGLNKYAWLSGTSALGSGNPVRALNSVQIVTGDGLKYWQDDFDGGIGASWAEASWLGVTPGTFDDEFAGVTDITAAGLVRSALTSFDDTQEYDVELFVCPFDGAHHGKYQIFLAMNDTTPVVTTDGFLIELTVTGTNGAYSGFVKRYSASSVTTISTFSTGNSTVAQPGWLRVSYDYTDGSPTGVAINVYWQGVNVTGALSTQVPAAGGKRMGFGLNCTVAGKRCLVDAFRVQYYASVEHEAHRNLLVASANGLLYKETFQGVMAQVSSNLKLSSSTMVESTARGQKLYFAEYELAQADTAGGGTRGTGNDRLDDAGVADWTTAFGAVLNAYDWGVVITGASANGTNGTYKISTVAAGELTLESVWCSAAATCNYRIVRLPKVYDPAAATLTVWSSDANPTTRPPPSDCRVICTYRDRLVLAGQTTSPHVVYFSAQNGPNDWIGLYDTSQTSPARAVALQNEDAGKVGEAVRALAPFSDDFLVIFCTNSVWILRGDPAYGGSLSNLSRNVGIVGPSAWCLGPEGQILFLSADGLYMIPPGGNGFPTPLSKDVLPRELMGIDGNLCNVSLAFDQQDNGVHIMVPAEDTRLVKHFWLDWPTKSFWQVKIAATQEPFRLLTYRAENANTSCVILGCRDGHMRRFYDTADVDDGTTFASYVLIGPLNMGGSAYHDGLLMEMSANLCRGSGNVTWSLLMGKSAEDAFNDTAFSTGTWEEGLNMKNHPRRRANAMYLKLANAENIRWAVENVDAVIRRAGRTRVA